MIPSLAVINSRGASLQGSTLTLTGVSANSIIFADRPFRAAGHVLTKHFLKEWDEGSDSFAKDPPNATISVLGADGDTVEDAVVVLKAPKLDGDKLTFDVSVLEGSLAKATGPASLFIDWFAARGYGGRTFVGGAGYHGAAWGGAWHGAYYAHPVGVGGGRRRGARRGCCRRGGRQRILSPLWLPVLRAAPAGLRLLPLSALLLKRRRPATALAPSFRARAASSVKRIEASP